MGKIAGVIDMLRSFVENEGVSASGNSLSRDDYYIVLPSATYQQLEEETVDLAVDSDNRLEDSVSKAYMKGYQLALRKYRKPHLAFMGYTVRESVTHFNVTFVHKDNFI